MGVPQVKEEIRELFEQIDSMFWSLEERRLIDRAVALAQEINDDELEFQARMRLTASAVQLGDTDSMLTSFAWCLAKYDSNPRKFGAKGDDNAVDIFWHFKWMVGALDRNSMFSLEQNEAMLEDMEQHYRKAGLGLSGVITARFTHYWRTGQLERAKEMRELLRTTPRDSHSHCDACGRSQLAEFAFEMGDEPEALRLVDEIVEGGFSCGEEPEGALGATLVAKLRAGRLDDARADHSRSYRLARSNADRIGIVADNIAFCAISGNEARGLAMVERHLNWLVHDPLDECGHFRLLLATGAVLEAVSAVGHSAQLVRGANNPELAAFFPQRQEPWTVAELAPAVWAAAAKIAAVFDARNGNSYVSGKIAAAKEMLNEHYDVPIHSDVFLTAEPPKAQEPTDFRGWVRRATTHAVSDMPIEGLAAGRKALELATNVEDRIEAYGAVISGLVELESYAEAEQNLAERIGLLRTAGRDLEASIEEQLGLILFGKVDGSAIGVLENAIAQWSAQPGPELAGLQLTLAMALNNDSEADAAHIGGLLRQAIANSAENPRLHQAALFRFACAEASSWDEAMECFEKVLATDPPDGLRAAALRMRARLFAGADQYDQAVADADEATRINASLRFHGPAAASAHLAGEVLLSAERPDEALSRMQFAVREAEQHEQGPVWAGLKFGLGKAQLLSGHTLEAVELFSEVNTLCMNGEAPGADRADTLSWLGRAYYEFEYYGNAVSCYSEAAELYEETERPVDAAGELLRKGRLLTQFEEYGDAYEALTKGIALAERDQEAHGLLVRLLETRGDASCKLGNDVGLADFDRAMEFARQDEQHWHVADLMDSKARGLASLNKYPEAIAAFLTAADGYAEAEDMFGAARAEFLAAQITCTELDQAETGATLMATALERVKADARPPAINLRNAIALKLGDVLESLGRVTEAGEVRAQVQE
jgi:tetratricopeptide (TPR) repeat protein